MYKNSTLIFNKYRKYVRYRWTYINPPQIKNKKTTIDRHKKFIRDKLDDILSPATKEYLKLKKNEKEMKK
jgi:hypothetical protein